jgi:hypothetical protein
LKAGVFPSDVIDDRFGAAIDLIASCMQTPAKVYFLHVSKKVLVEASHFMEYFCSYEQTGPGSPKNRYGGIVLSTVGFAVLENSPSAVSIAQPI